MTDFSVPKLNNYDSPTTANYYESLLSIQSASFKVGGSGDLKSMLAMSVKDLILLLAPNGVRLNAEINAEISESSGNSITPLEGA